MRAMPISTSASLDQYAAMTPATVRAAMQQWLTRPAFTIRLEPGERPPYDEAKAEPAPRRRGRSAHAAYPACHAADRRGAAARFPRVEHVALSNGVRVAYAQRGAVPTTQVALSFDAGFSADAPNARGLQNLTIGLLDEGADGMTSQQIAEAQERLGAAIGASGGGRPQHRRLSALTANLAPSLDLLADVVQRPTFGRPEVERVRAQR